MRKQPPLTEGNILAWADAHHSRTGQWLRIWNTNTLSLPAGVCSTRSNAQEHNKRHSPAPRPDRRCRDHGG
jgi:hypothetical protein